MSLTSHPGSEMDAFQERLARVRARIARAERAHGRPPGSVRLLAVSKTQPTPVLRVAWETGLRAFAESYYQEAVQKIEALAGLGIEWHFIGPIQSNKTRGIAQRFAWVHSVDREKIARRLSEHRPPSMPPLQVCLQVNIDREPTKSGCPPEAVETLARYIAQLPRLRLRGLMTIPAATQDPERQRAAFARVRRLQEHLNAQGLALDTLSMGMSRDLEAAIAEGATVVRIGTALFGPRPPRPRTR